MFKKVMDKSLDRLLREVYSGLIGFLPADRQKPWVQFRIGCTVFYYDPWNVCFWGMEMEAKHE